jgi:hypothetical protein
MHTIVTHLSVDLDCITATWLVVRFFPEWEGADIVFTPQQVNWEGVVPDSDPNILYLDTGYGRFDHHQSEDYTSATKLAYRHLLKQGWLDDKNGKALGRLVSLVNELDHFAECFYPDAASDRWDLGLVQQVGALKQSLGDDRKVMEIVFTLLDAHLQHFKNKIKAEQEIKQGYVFQSRWGKTLVMSTRNDEALRLAQKLGFQLVAIKDPEKGGIRIKTPPKKELDLTRLHEQILKKDTRGSWFLHVGRNMLLNGSSKKPDQIPSPLTLQQLIEIIKGI